MFGHLALVEDGADRLADLGRPSQRVFLAPNTSLDLAQVGLGQRQQLVALAPPLLGQQRVPAHHQPFIRIVRTADLGHIACVEQGELQQPAVRQLADRWCTQCGDPIEARRAQSLLDPSTGNHAAIADHHHVAQPEALFQLGDLGGDGGRIGSIAFQHLDRHGATVRGTQQANDQLRPVAAAVAAVTVAGQGTAAAFEIGRGDVVEHQCAVREMAAGELVFDEVCSLPSQSRVA